MSSSEDVEKRLMRTLSELSSLSESQLRSCRSIVDVFSPDHLLVRVRLKDHALKLLNLDILSQGVKALDVVWQRFVYSPISVCRNMLQKNVDDFEFHSALVHSHLLSCIGVYRQIIGSLEALEQERFNTKASSKANWKKQEKLIQFKLTMAMGDLHRYLVDFSSNNDNSDDYAKLAEYYYLRAHDLNEKSGSPFNQLAVLASVKMKKEADDSDSAVDVAFFALKSVTSSEESKLALSNLRSLLKRKEINLDKLVANKEKDVQNEMTRCKLLFVKFIKAIIGENNSKGNENIEKGAEIGRMWLTSMETCLYNESNDNDELGRSSNFASSQVLKMTASLVLTLQLKDVASKVKSMIRALMLALFLQLLTKYTGDICVQLRGPEAVIDLFDGNDDGEGEDEKTTEGQNKGPRKSKKGLGMLRRRRKREESDESDVSIEDSSDDASAESSDMEEVPARGRLSISDEEDDDDITSNDNYDDAEETDKEKGGEVYEVPSLSLLSRHELNPSLRICCIWLKSEKLDVKSIEASSLLFGRLKALFRLLQKHYDYDGQGVGMSDDAYSFVEDHLLPLCLQSPAGGPQGSKGDSNGNFMKARLAHWRSFQHFLSNIDGTGIVAINQSGSGEMIKTSTVTTASKLDNRQLMESMAKLWLQHEVKGLESTSRSQSRMMQGLAHYRSSPYMVIHHLAVMRHLRLVERIVDTKRFAVIVPTIVVDELDRLKRSHQSARLAIRWLERQFQFGNRWLRSQRPDERLKLDDCLYPEKTNRRTRCWLAVMECCHHFSSRVERGTEGMKITCLTAAEIEDDQALEEQLNLGSISSSLGVRIENVDKFVAHGLGPAKGASKKHRDKTEH